MAQTSSTTALTADNCQNYRSLAPVSVHSGESPLIATSNTFHFDAGGSIVASFINNRGIQDLSLEILKEWGAAGVALIGNPDVYRSSGFTSDGRLTYKDLETRYVQRIVFCGPSPEGELHYADAFDQAEKPD